MGQRYESTSEIGPTRLISARWNRLFGVFDLPDLLMATVVVFSGQLQFREDYDETVSHKFHDFAKLQL
jgi:hypothetical protein